jgi:hypothetical protein
LATTSLATSTDPHSTILKGIWLWLARLAWLFILAANLVLLYYLLPRNPDTMFLQERFASSWPALRGLLSLREYGWYVMALYYLLLLAFLGIGIFIAWRRSSDWMALFTSAVLVSLGTQASKISVYDTRFMVLPGYEWLVLLDQLSEMLSVFGLLGLIYLFPDGRIVPRHLRWLLPAIAAPVIVFLVSPLSENAGWTILLLAAILLLAGGIFSQVYRYQRISTPQQRQQVKWAVFGLLAYPLYLFSTGLLSLILLDDRFPIQSALAFLNLHLTVLTLLLTPLTLGFSILRYRLWDIDLLVRRTLVYGALTFTLALIFFGSVTAMQLLFTTVSGQRSAVATVISTLLIAALFSPLRRRIQNDIDRRFFRQKYNAEQIVEAFGGRLREQVDMDEMSAHLLSVVEQALQPEHASLWIIPLALHKSDDKEA